jgi:hypothetical protein
MPGLLGGAAAIELAALESLSMANCPPYHK